ncbi:MAG: class I SAM-dependent methyltransferase [Candidatus Binatia bacterium]
MMTLSRELKKGALNEINFSFAPQLILWTALELEIFPALEGGANSLDRLAALLRCSEKGLRRILDCLAAMGFVEKRNQTYDLTAVARSYLLPSSENYVGHLFSGSAQLMKYWLTLPEAVRTGRPTLGLFPDADREAYDFEVIEALFQFHKHSAWELARAVLQKATPTRILDVGAGSAVWSLPFASQCPQLEVTAIDFPPVLALARKFARRFGVEKQYRFIGGEILTVDLGEQEFDLVLLGHICHSEGPRRSRELFSQCFRALKNKGRLLIMDYIADEGRASEFLPLLLALNTLLGTDEGDTFTMSEYLEWLRQAGFIGVESLCVKGHAPVVMACKEARQRL